MPQPLIKRKSGQASIEYILLLALIATIAFRGIKQIREIFFGWGEEQGAVIMMLDSNIIERLSSNPANGF